MQSRHLLIAIFSFPIRDGARLWVFQATQASASVFFTSLFTEELLQLLQARDVGLRQAAQLSPRARAKSERKY